MDAQQREMASLQQILIVADRADVEAELRSGLLRDDRRLVTYSDCSAAAQWVSAGQRLDVVVMAAQSVSAERRKLLSTLERCEAHFESVWFLCVQTEELLIEALRAGCYDVVPSSPDGVAELSERIDSASIDVSIRREQDQLFQDLINGAERYELAARGANDGLWDWDRRCNEMYLSPRWKNILGFDDAELRSDPAEWWDLIHPEDRNDMERMLDARVLRGTDVFHKELRMRHKDGSYRWTQVRGIGVLGARGEVIRVVGSLSDVTDRKLAEHRLVHEALHDQLTGLANRTLFLEHVGRFLTRRRTVPGPDWAVMVLGLDDFQAVNESIGPHGGDEVLCRLGHRLGRSFSEAACVARVGGDEFAILAAGTEEAPNPMGAHQRLVAALSEPLTVFEQEVFVSAAIGIAPGLSTYDDAVEVLRDASIALHRAKVRGRGRSAIFEQSMHAEALRRFKLDSALRHAVTRRQFMLCYQPIVSLQDGRIVSFEALLRWVHPERGRVSPAEFIPLAERNGLIIEIGAWALEQACRQTVAWQRQAKGGPRLGISVNVSEKQLMTRGFLDTVRRVIEATGIEPATLHIEITESVLMRDFSAAASVLGSLKEMGVIVSMDDFGTGYSALSYLHKLPFDTLKIDRAFVNEMDVNVRTVALVEGAVSMAHALGMSVVAEGIETEHQLVLLRASGCDFGQGYLFAAPLDVDKAEELLLDGGRKIARVVAGGGPPRQRHVDPAMS